MRAPTYANRASPTEFAEWRRRAIRRIPAGGCVRACTRALLTHDDGLWRERTAPVHHLVCECLCTITIRIGGSRKRCKLIRTLRAQQMAHRSRERAHTQTTATATTAGNSISNHFNLARCESGASSTLVHRFEIFSIYISLYMYQVPGAVVHWCTCVTQMLHGYIYCDKWHTPLRAARYSLAMAVAAASVRTRDNNTPIVSHFLVNLLFAAVERARDPFYSHTHTHRQRTLIRSTHRQRFETLIFPPLQQRDCDVCAAAVHFCVHRIGAAALGSSSLTPHTRQRSSSSVRHYM